MRAANLIVVLGATFSMSTRVFGNFQKLLIPSKVNGENTGVRANGGDSEGCEHNGKKNALSTKKKKPSNF